MDNIGNKLKVIYDIVSVPEDVNIDQLFNIMKNGGIVIWDSSKGGTEPKIIEDSDLHTYDVALIGKEAFEEKFGNLIED
jgi:hypothetical protein